MLILKKGIPKRDLVFWGCVLAGGNYYIWSKDAGLGVNWMLLVTANISIVLVSALFLFIAMHSLQFEITDEEIRIIKNRHFSKSVKWEDIVETKNSKSVFHPGIEVRDKTGFLFSITRDFQNYEKAYQLFRSKFVIKD